MFAIYRGNSNKGIKIFIPTSENCTLTEAQIYEDVITSVSQVKKMRNVLREPLLSSNSQQ